jgi:hypothetical protein
VLEEDEEEEEEEEEEEDNLGIASMDLLRFLETRRKVTNKCQITKFQLNAVVYPYTV